MSYITLCSKVSGHTARVKIENVNFSSTVGELKEKCARQVDFGPQEFDLFFAGVPLRSDKVLEGYGVKAGVTVYAMKALKPAATLPEKSEPMDEAASEQVVTALQAALLNPAYRNIVEKMVTDEETMENLVIAIPELGQDPVAMTMLKELELLAMLADPSLIRKVIEVHPCLGQAALYIAAAVTEEGAKLGPATQSSTGSYSLDRMSDDEDDARPGPSSSQGTQSEITGNQLAAALAAASGSQGSSSQTAQGLTLDFFQQAMAQAQDVAHSRGSSQESGSSQTPDMETQLQQMRDMGITDESVARTALAATGGNVQAALEIIFGDGSLGM